MSRIVESGADGFLDKRQDGSSIERLANAIAAVLDVGYYWSRVVHDVRAKLFGNPRCWIKILTPREIDIVRQIAVGRTDLEAAQRLGICEATVKWHRHGVMAKLGLRRERQLVRFANHVGLSRMHS